MFSFSFEEIALQKYFLVFIFILLELLSREDCCLCKILEQKRAAEYALYHRSDDKSPSQSYCHLIGPILG